jgi:hypothetical protein
MVSFQKMDLGLGAVIIDAKLGAEVQGHFLRVVDVTAYVTRTWHELGAVDLGVNCYGSEL